MSDLAGFLKTQLAKIAASSLTEKRPLYTKLKFLVFDDFTTQKSKNHSKKTTGAGPSCSKLGKDNPGFKQSKI